MRFVPTPLAGVLVIEQQPVRDDRGAFSRTYCRDEFAAAGIDFQPYQESLSVNHARHTLRGLHFQRAPHQEQKLVRCVRGAIFDVVVDLRRDSPTWGQWFGITLTADTGAALFVPRGLAHGFLTLEDNSDVAYAIDTPYVADAASGVRWDSPRLAIEWPHAPAVLSDRDANWPDDDQ